MFGCCLHLKKEVVTNHIKIKSIQLKSKFNILTWHKTMFTILIPNIDKQFGARYYIMESCLKVNTNLCTM